MASAASELNDYPRVENVLFCLYNFIIGERKTEQTRDSFLVHEVMWECSAGTDLSTHLVQHFVDKSVWPVLALEIICAILH